MLKEKLNFGKNQAFFNRSSTKLGYQRFKKERELEKSCPID